MWASSVARSHILLAWLLVLAPVFLPWARGEPPTPGNVLVRDEAGLFDAPLHAELRHALEGLRHETGIELFLVTRCIPSLDETELAAYELFKSLVRSVQHYKVILVLVAIDRKRGEGLVSTNLGAGVYHLVEKKDCEGLFVKEGESFSPSGVKQGISFLCERITSAMAQRHRTDVVTGTTPTPGEGDGMGSWPLVITLFVLAIALGMWYLAIRKPHCPRCGTELRTRVNIVVGTGGKDLARKTFKCFKCGYARKRSLWPTTLRRRRTSRTS